MWGVCHLCPGERPGLRVPLPSASLWGLVQMSSRDRWTLLTPSGTGPPAPLQGLAGGRPTHGAQTRGLSLRAGLGTPPSVATLLKLSPEAQGALQQPAP